MSWIEVEGASLRYRITGADAGGTTLVLIHEAGGSIESWDAVLPLLPRSRVLCYDQRGFGLSERASTLGVAQMVGDLHALLRALGLAEAPVLLVGTAIGGTIALAYAATHPVHVRGVVATSPVTGPSTPAMREAMAGRAALVEAEGMRAVADAALARSYPESLRGDGERFRRYRARLLGNDPQSFAALSRCYVDVDLTPSYPSVRCPALVVGCRHDGIKPPAECAAAAEAMPRGRFVELDSGHFVAVQAPELLVATVQQFAWELS